MIDSFKFVSATFPYENLCIVPCYSETRRCITAVMFGSSRPIFQVIGAWRLGNPRDASKQPFHAGRMTENASRPKLRYSVHFEWCKYKYKYIVLFVMEFYRYDIYFFFIWHHLVRSSVCLKLLGHLWQGVSPTWSRSSQCTHPSNQPTNNTKNSATGGSVWYFLWF